MIQLGTLGANIPSSMWLYVPCRAVKFHYYSSISYLRKQLSVCMMMSPFFPYAFLRSSRFRPTRLCLFVRLSVCHIFDPCKKKHSQHANLLLELYLLQQFYGFNAVTQIISWNQRCYNPNPSPGHCSSSNRSFI